MHIRRAPDVRSSEITHERLYLRRREFFKRAAIPAFAAAAGLPWLDTRAVAQDTMPNVKKAATSSTKRGRPGKT